MSNESLNERLEVLENAFPVLSTKVENDLLKLIKGELSETIQIEILSSGINTLVEKAIENSPTFQDMKALSKANHDLKKENGELKTDIKKLHDRLLDLDRKVERNELDLIENKLIKVWEAIGGQRILVLKILEKMGWIPAPKNSPEKPVIVSRKILEEQKCFVFNNPKEYDKKAWRASVDQGLSKRAIANLLGMKSVNDPDRIKGRIQDYIAENHPDKDIYVRVKIIGYDNGKDVVRFYKPEPAQGLFNIPIEKIQPWEPHIRQAIENKTAIFTE
jgi:hypothetical protein